MKFPPVRALKRAEKLETWDSSPSSFRLQHVFDLQRPQPLASARLSVSFMQKHWSRDSDGACSRRRPAALAAAATFSYRPEISQDAPLWAPGPAANQFPTNNNDPLEEKHKAESSSLRPRFMSAFLCNERPLVFVSVPLGPAEKQGEVNCDGRAASPCSPPADGR